jgi:hypothetical protein
MAQAIEKDNAALGESLLTSILAAIEKGIEDHRKKYHPICDPQELDHVLRLLREEFERRKHGQL